MEAYIAINTDDCLPYATYLAGDARIYQEDNAPIRANHMIESLIHGRNNKTLEWSTGNFYLNPIDNLQADLARRFYQHGRHFASTKILKSSTEVEWIRTYTELC